MRIITSGSRYLDIDAYAGIIAYAELLQLQGIDAIAASSAPLNESIPASLRALQAPLKTDYTPADSDTFTLIDISEPDFFDPLVTLSRVDEIIDHHPGLEEYWMARIGDKADIEFVGAACTQVYERWASSDLTDQMSPNTAKLLVAGILDNTLNFKAKVATTRDQAAYDALVSHANIPDNWRAEYFNECQEAILADPETAIQGDSKVIAFKTAPEQPLSVGQIVAWEAGDVLSNHQTLIARILSAVKPGWFMNIVSVGEGCSYFFCEDPELQAWLEKLLDVKFDEHNIAEADRLWLRKEIIKADLEAANS